MKVAVLFEASGRTRDAFAARGHDAVSVDLRATESPGPHIQADAFAYMESEDFQRGIDLAVLHYTCTFLAVSGIHWNGRVAGRTEKTEAALGDVRQLLRLLGRKRFVFENPVGILSTQIVRPDGRPWRAMQTIQPYQFGEDASKKTCLWFNGLLPLRIPPPSAWHPGRLIEHPPGSGKIVRRWSNQTDGGQNRLAPSADRWAQRSETYPAIAAALAENYG